MSLLKRTLFITFIMMIFVSFTATGAVKADTHEEQPIDVETDELELHLQAQNTQIDHDETSIFTFSASNYVTNEEELTIQLIIQAPSGSNVFSTSGVEEGSSSQFTTTTKLDPGEQDSLRIQVDPSEPGEHTITGQAIYYFGDNQDAGEGTEATIQIEQTPPPPSATDQLLTSLPDLSPPLTIFALAIVFFIIVLIIIRPDSGETQSLTIKVASVVLILSLVLSGVVMIDFDNRIIQSGDDVSDEEQLIESDSATDLLPEPDNFRIEDDLEVIEIEQNPNDPLQSDIRVFYAESSDESPSDWVFLKAYDSIPEAKQKYNNEMNNARENVTEDGYQLETRTKSQNVDETTKFTHPDYSNFKLIRVRNVVFVVGSDTDHTDEIQSAIVTHLYENHIQTNS